MQNIQMWDGVTPIFEITCFNYNMLFAVDPVTCIIVIRLHSIYVKNIKA